MIAVIVLNWKGASDTVACLDSLTRSTVPVVPLVVDNGSGDGSIDYIRSRHPDVDLLPLGQNLGYAGGNNRGLAWALDRDFDYIAVLNNDTTVEPNTLEELTSAAFDRPVALSPRILRSSDGSDWYVGATAVPPLGLPMHDQGALPTEIGRRPTEFLTGCCIFASAETWRAVGLFDEGYFLIFEDSEWSMRARQRGIELEVAPMAIVHHQVSASFERANGVGLYYFTRNALRFAWSRSSPTVSTVWRLVVRPSLRDVRNDGMAATQPALIRLVSLAHALRRSDGPAHGAVLRRLGVAA